MSSADYIAEPKPKRARWDYPALEHRGGVPWWEAQPPRRLHRCSPQSRGWLGFTLVLRCACGAVKRDGDRFWMERNSRSRSDWSIPERPYMERKREEIDRLDAMTMERAS